LFIQENVQTLLRKLTAMDLKKVFKTLQTDLQKPNYKFMTTAQLEQAVNQAKKRGEKKIQMPPVLKARKPIDDVISFDPKLQGHDQSAYIFTDISTGFTDRNRLIVARDVDGTLRHASWEERDRMNQIYFPKDGRKLGTPRMFEPANMERLLDEEEAYEFILDRACIQYEPDDPKFIDITSTVYKHIDSHKRYDALKSTRHYGPMAFHLAFCNNMDNILMDSLTKFRVDDSYDLVTLYSILHVNSEVAKKRTPDTDKLELIKLYIESSSSKRYQVELAYQACVEFHQNQTQYREDVKTAHGQR